MEEPVDRESRDVAETKGVTSRERLDIETPHGSLRLDPTTTSPEDIQLVEDRFGPLERQELSTRLYHVDRRGGRSCESCAGAIEQRLTRIDGIADVSLSFLSGLLRVTFNPDELDTAAVDEAIRGLNVIAHDIDDPDATAKPTSKHLSLEAVFVALTFVGMFGGFVAGYLDMAWEIEWGLYALAYIFGGWYGLIAALESLQHYQIDIDVLMLTAAGGAAAIGQPFEGAMLLFLFSLSNVLEQYAFGRSRQAIKSLLELRPETARLLVDGKEETVPLSQVELGDIFVVRPGDRIPLDGEVIDGSSSVDESSLTGESVPLVKEPGEEVYAGTIAEDGTLEVEVTRLAHDSAITRLIHLVEEAKSEKAPTQRLIDRLEQPYVIGVFVMTFVAVAIPAALGADWFPTVYRAMTLMVAASPCAVIISTPAVVLSAISAGARSGVLFKGGEYVESAASVDVIAFDKTGTLTEGETQLESVLSRDGATIDGTPVTDDRVLELAAGVQSRSEHHLATATVDAAEGRSLSIPAVDDFQAVPGKGVRGTVDGVTIHIGNRQYFADVDGPDRRIGFEETEVILTELEDEGQTSVFVATETDEALEVIGLIGYTDTVRPGAQQAIAELREQGIEQVLMLTGDTKRVAEAVAADVDIDEVYAELLPEEKVEIVEELLAEHEGVAMVGDGVNDAPALATATIGIGMGGAGTDVALETADVVLMADDITKLPYVLNIGNRARRTLMINFAIAFGAMGIMILAILARGLPLPIAVVGHEGSTVLVSLNGLRLLGYRE